MIQLTPANKLKGCTEEEYEELPETEKAEVLKDRGDVLPVSSQNIVRVLPYEGERHPKGQSRVEYVTGSNDVVEESPERVLKIANRSQRRLEHLIKQMQGALRGI
jgi:hypothetical protein